MVPAAGCESDGRAYDVGEDVEGVEVAAIGEECLNYFRADREARGADYEGEVDAAAARGFEDPVEGELCDCLLVVGLVCVGRLLVEYARLPAREMETCQKLHLWLLLPSAFLC